MEGEHTCPLAEIRWLWQGGCGSPPQTDACERGRRGWSVKATTLAVIGSPETEGPRSRASSFLKAFHGNTDPNQVPD